MNIDMYPQLLRYLNCRPLVLLRKTRSIMPFRVTGRFSRTGGQKKYLYPLLRPKKYMYPLLKKLSTFSFALLALCFALSCSSSTSQIKSKSSLKSKSYERIAMRELRKELAQRRKEGFPNILKGPSGTYVYDTKKQEYVLGKKPPSEAELRALAAQKAPSSAHPHRSKVRAMSYKKTAMRELRNDLAQMSKKGFPNLIEGLSGPHVWDRKKREYVLDQELLEWRKTKGLREGWNKDKYVLRGRLRKSPALALKPTPLTPSTPSIEAKPLASKTPSPPTPSIEKSPQLRKPPPIPPKAPQAAKPVTVPTKPPQTAKPATVPTKPPQTAKPATVPTNPPQTAVAVPALPKATASQSNCVASNCVASQSKAHCKKKEAKWARSRKKASEEWGNVQAPRQDRRGLEKTQQGRY